MRIAAKKSFLLQALSAAQFASSFSPSLASARRIPSSALFSTKTDTMTTDVANFIDSTNAGYEKLHLAYELQFWGTKMALSGPEYSTDELTRTKGEMEAFLADESKLAKTRDLLGSVPADSAEAKTLKMLEPVGTHLRLLHHGIGRGANFAVGGH